MKLFSRGKDGGPDSCVTGYWLVEIKFFFSIALLRFGNGSRESFHSHAFNAISWLLRGRLREQHTNGHTDNHKPSIVPIVTRRSTFHRVFSEGVSWVLTFRGPWSRTWKEHSPATGIDTVLANGRKVVDSSVHRHG